MIELIFEYAISIISFLGYFGVFILMTLESMIFPIPSEAVMPFAGYIAYQGKFNLLSVVFIATLGSIFGSLISYYIGNYCGKKFVSKIGKYMFLNEEHLIMTEQWFNKRGQSTIFISRFIPVVRHFISIPAGIVKMNKVKFITYTFLGAFGWNYILTYAGFKLGENWKLISDHSRYIDITVIIGILLIFIWYLYKRKKEKAILSH